MEPAMADGGEVIIYAPHVNEVSRVHGALHRRNRVPLPRLFRRTVAAVRALSRRHPRAFDAPEGVRHVTTRTTAVETPRVEVTLATGISPERCARINLGYVDPAPSTARLAHRPRSRYAARSASRRNAVSRSATRPTRSAGPLSCSRRSRRRLLHRSARPHELALDESIDRPLVVANHPSGIP